MLENEHVENDEFTSMLSLQDRPSIEFARSDSSMEASSKGSLDFADLIEHEMLDLDAVTSPVHVAPVPEHDSLMHEERPLL